MFTDCWADGGLEEAVKSGYDVQDMSLTLVWAGRRPGGVLWCGVYINHE